MVPQDDALYPTLGPQVCDFIEQNLVFGPGDLRGQPAIIDAEKQALIYRFYEVHPRGHALAGRRRFKRCAASMVKGTAKTELAAWIVACELHPEGPVRCTGWTHGGEPIGGPVTDPYIAMVAYTEEQSDELAYTALRVILEEGPLKHDFDIGLDRIQRLKGDGIAQALAGSPNARDGARTTFAHYDETHRWVLPRLKDAFKVMQANLPKRKLADAWSLETTTAFEPGVGSVAEGTMEYAQAVVDGSAKDSSLFFFHRHAGDQHDLQTAEGFRAAVIEASGPSAEWRDIDAIVSLWNDPTSDRAYLERVYCNLLVQSTTQAFDVGRWDALMLPGHTVPDGALITLGFDGSQFHDATGLVATEVSSGYQWVAGVWECPPGQESWQVPTDEVDTVVRALFSRYQVWRLYADPPFWQSWIAQWRGSFGEERVIEWWTNRRRQMASALENFDSSIIDGKLAHDGHDRLRAHMGHARRDTVKGGRSEDGRPLWLIRKERPDSPHKIDVTMAAVLSWEARTDAISSGAISAMSRPTPRISTLSW